MQETNSKFSISPYAYGAGTPTCSEQIQSLLRWGRGPALISLALTLDCNVPFRALKRIRLNDVDCDGGVIRISRTYYRIHDSLLEDLKEIVQNQSCGSLVHQGERVRSESSFLFSEELIALVLGKLKECKISPKKWRSFGEEILEERKSFDTQSPLDLFSRGPKILRRLSGGSSISHYFWRVLRNIVVVENSGVKLPKPRKQKPYQDNLRIHHQLVNSEEFSTQFQNLQCKHLQQAPRL